VKVALIKYNAGNIQSVAYALNRMGIEPIITDSEEEIRASDKVIFPGVGEASTAMHYLKEKLLDRLIPSLNQPVLGICLGLQLMCRFSGENATDCLAIFPLDVRRFPPEGKVPQIGWNALSQLKNPLFKNIKEGEYVYFVHSYYAPVSEFTVATCEYLLPFSAALQRDNFYAVQFHPEKSGETGAKILKNFLEL